MCPDGGVLASYVPPAPCAGNMNLGQPLTPATGAAPTGRHSAAAVPPATGRRVVYHYVHYPAFELGALQRVNGDSRGVVIEFDDGEAACTARTVPRDPQRPDLAEW